MSKSCGLSPHSSNRREHSQRCSTSAGTSSCVGTYLRPRHARSRLAHTLTGAQGRGFRLIQAMSEDDGDDDNRLNSSSVPPEIAQLLKEVGDEEPNVWATKPAWCQPWSIIASGLLVIAAPAGLFHLTWLSALFAIPIAAWWYLFLLVYPSQFKAYVEAARGYYKR